MKDQPKFNIDDYLDFRPFDQLMNPLASSSPEYVQNNSFSRNQTDNFFDHKTEEYATSPNKEWDYYSDLKSDKDIFASNFGNPQITAEKATLSPYNAVAEVLALTIARSPYELPSTTKSDLLTSAEHGIEGGCSDALETQSEVIGDRSQDQDDDDDEFTYGDRKKVHIDEETKPIDKVAKLGAKMDGYDFSSSPAQPSTNDTTTHEDGNIQIKVPRKRGRPRKNVAEKSLDEILIDYLKNSKNEYDKIWFEKDPAIFESFFRFSQNEQTILDTEKISKKKQNSKRNIPGLIFNRVIKNMLDVLESNDMNTIDIKRYIVEILNANNIERKKFPGLISYFENLRVEVKTWKSIKAQISKNPIYRKILFECIDAFLSTTGENDFNDWINDPNCRLKENAKAVLREHNHKKSFRDKFIKLRSELAFNLLE